MTSRRGVLKAPVDHVVDGRWPAARIDGTLEAEVVQQFAANLVEAASGRSWREIGRLCGVDHTTVAAVASGRRWVDVVTVVRLEAQLGRLWPDGHARPDR